MDEIEATRFGEQTGALGIRVEPVLAPEVKHDPSYYNFQPNWWLQEDPLRRNNNLHTFCVPLELLRLAANFDLERITTIGCTATALRRYRKG